MKTSPFTKVKKICLALPDTTFERRNGHATFFVKKKVFAYFLDNHHGDGIVSLACKVLPGDHHRLVEAHPEQFYLPAYIGPRGWVAVRLDIRNVDWEEVGELAAGSHMICGPKRRASR